MSYRASLEFPVEAEALFDHIVDPDVVAARFEQAGDADIELRVCGPNGDGFEVDWTRSAVADVPGFASKFLKPTNTLHQVDRWGPPADDGSREGTFTGTAKGAPIALSGDMSIEAVSTGSCRYTIEGHLNVKVPLVGGRIARWAEGESSRRLEAELQFLLGQVA